MKNNHAAWVVSSLALLACLTGWSAQQSSSEESLSSRSKQLSQERVNRETEQMAQDPKMHPVAEALSAVQETETANQLLDQGHAEQAKAALTRALGKTDLVLSAHPDVGLVPISMSVQVVDTHISDAALKQMTIQIQEYVKQGRYQAARPLLHNFASEIDVRTVNLPLAAYPAAIKSAVGLIDQGKTQEAKVQLNSALNSLVYAERVIPLPVLRAQALVDEVNREVSENKVDKAQASQFLNEADQQLAYAEKLGYGTQKQDFASLHASIQDVKRTINGNQPSQSFLAKLRSDLDHLVKS